MLTESLACRGALLDTRNTLVSKTQLLPLWALLCNTVQLFEVSVGKGHEEIKWINALLTPYPNLYKIYKGETHK